jgi:hypothetical protein
VTEFQDPALAHTYITTVSGRKVWLDRMTVDDVRMCDIVHSLSMQCRYVGHSRRFYSVAEHSMLVAWLAMQDCPKDRYLEVCCLLHDAGEAYQGDQSRPMKVNVPAIKELQHSIEVVVNTALGLPHPDVSIWERVKCYDIIALHIEAAQLFSPAPQWVEHVDPKYYRKLECRLPDEARRIGVSSG